MQILTRSLVSFERLFVWEIGQPHHPSLHSSLPSSLLGVRPSPSPFSNCCTIFSIPSTAGVCVCACTCTMRACMHACVLYMCVYVQAVHSLGFAHRANFSSRYRTEYSTPCHIILYAILFTAMLQRLPNPVIHPSLRNSAPLVTNSPISPLTSSRF